MLSKRIYNAALMILCVASPISVLANTLVIPPRPAPPFEQTVNELLALDAARALAAEREKANGQRDPSMGVLGSRVEAPAPEAPKAPEKPALAPAKLLAIYGVGSAIHADILIDGSKVVFASGRKAAVRGTDKGWSLRRIATPCVELIEPNGSALQLCSYRDKSVGGLS